jgi:methylmalonyl-CoA mutase
MLGELQRTWSDKRDQLLKDMQVAAVQNMNLFEKLMEVTRYCSLGQITNALFEVGGQYRRNM